MKCILIISIIFILCGCTPLIQAEPEPVIETVIETVTEYVEVENTERIDELENEVQQYRDLISSLNKLLSCVYYGYAENDKYILDGFTAFSIFYNEKYYLITAGHCVENEDGKFYNHKFKANIRGDWVYPQLLIYEDDFERDRDYAIFYTDNISGGLKYNLNNTEPSFILGQGEKNLLKNYNQYITYTGESGSPVINLDGEVMGIATGNLVDIDIVLRVLDNLGN